jgi:hypothetical protein
MKYILLFENYKKMKWEIITSNPDKKIEGKRLIDIVSNAYRNTNMGSFVKTISDVIKSKWLVIDCDEYDDIDACIFYRGPRKDEKWDGYKIQGIGHDGDPVAKKILIKKLIDTLKNDNGFWIEASGTLEYILEENLERVTDIEIIKRLFPDSKIVFSENGQYKRTLGNTWIEESVFGLPILR